MCDGASRVPDKVLYAKCSRAGLKRRRAAICLGAKGDTQNDLFDPERIAPAARLSGSSALYKPRSRSPFPLERSKHLACRCLALLPEANQRGQ
jgi:hypothetical protein